MSVADLKPEGLTDAMRTYVRWTPKVSVVPQGMFGGQFAVWLEIEGAGSRVIGYGLPDEAVAEAQAFLRNLAEGVPASMCALLGART